MKINWPFLIILLIAVVILSVVAYLAWVHVVTPFLDALDAGAPWADAVAILISVSIFVVALGRKS